MSLKKRFVVFAEARTGSTRFCDLLRSHPSIFCDEELFHSDEIQTYGKVGRENDAWNERGTGVGWDGWTIASRDQDPAGFISTRMTRASREPFVEAYGFKLMRYQSRAAIDTVLADASYRVILLTRRDKLAQFASLQTARQTGCWKFYEGTERRATRVHFQLGTFLKYAYRSHRAYGRLRRQLKTNGHHILEVTYEDSLLPETVGQVLDFLGVDPREKVTTSLVKQGSWNSADRFDRPRVAAFSNAMWQRLRPVLPQ